MRRILHIDMDAFFAAIEQLRRPELKGKPVVVGGSGNPNQRGVVSTASYEARKFGIHSAMPLRTAYQRCPQAVFVPVNFAAYIEASKKIKGILREISPVYESGGLDEAYLDITDVPGTSEEIADKIKQEIRTATGLTCSIGIAPNKLLAKIGSDLEKPDGLTILTLEDVPKRIWPLGVRKLLWVGPKTEEKLTAMKVKTIADLAALPLEALTARFGDAHGRYLHDASRGKNESPVAASSKTRSISRETTFQIDTRDREKLLEVMEQMTERLVEDLREDGYLAKTAAVKLRFADFETLTRQSSLSRPAESRDELWPLVVQCLDRIQLDRPVRLIGVRLAGLVKEGEIADGRDPNLPIEGTLF